MYPRKNPYLVWYHFESVSDIESNSLPGSVILDLGCGEGLLLDQIKDSYARIGVDVSKTCLKEVITKSSAQFCVMSAAESFPFQNSTVDVVLSHQSIEHVVDQGKAISEVSRVLKPNGLFIASTPVKGLLGRFAARSRNEKGQRVLSPDHVSEYKSEADMVESFARQSNGALIPMKLKKKSVRVPLSRIIPWLYNKGYRGPMFPALLYYSDVYAVFRKDTTVERGVSRNESESKS